MLKCIVLYIYRYTLASESNGIITILKLYIMKILSFIINLFLSVGFIVCFFSLLLLHLANWQLLSIIFLMFACYIGLHINYKLSTLKN